MTKSQRKLKKMELYWINKDCHSEELTQSSGIDRRKIQKHVQRHSKRNQKQRAYKATSASPQGSKVLTIGRQLSGSCDPFCSASVCLNPTLCDLLQSHVRIYLQPSIWIHEANTFEGKRFKDNDSMTWILQNAVEDSLVMYSILNAAASRVRNAEAAPCISVSEAEELFFAHNAIRLLRGRLAKTEERTKAEIERLVACIAFLLASEVYKEEESYFTGRAHSRAIVQLLIPIGGIMKMDNAGLRHQLLMSDLFLAMITMEPCLHGCDYDPGPLRGWAKKALYKTEGPPLGAILLRSDDEIIPPLIWRVIFNSVECYSAFTYMSKTTMTGPQYLHMSHWITNRNMSLLNQLLAFVTNDERVNAVRMAVILWMVLWTNSILRSKAPKRIVTMLQQLLANIGSSKWLPYVDIQFWILCMGYSCAEQDSNIAASFENQIRNIYRNKSEILWPSRQPPNLSQAIEGFLCGFLYHGPIQHSKIQQLARSISWNPAKKAD